jgi:hypothetical protein
MHGQNPTEQPDGEQEVDVDLTLEIDISGVVKAVDEYLDSPTDISRKSLLTELEKLDAQTELSDAYHGRLDFPLGPPQSWVVGATNDVPEPEYVPAPEFEAQVALVKAAKIEVTRSTPEALADLRAARQALAVWPN